MRHRIIGNIHTGLGNPAPEILPNTGDISRIRKDFCDEAIELYFKEWGGFDYNIEPGRIVIGIEPAYMYQRQKIILIDKRKELSYIQTGYAFGAYGSGVRATKRYYEDFKYKCKFTKFIDKWHGILFKR